MGAWGVGIFDNDTALDWAHELEMSGDGLGFLEDTVSRIALAGGDYLDAHVASEVLAACDVVARLQGRWGTRNSYTEDVDRWVEANPCSVPRELVEASIAAVDRVVTEPSELLELWGEDPDAGWLADVADLRARLSA